VYEFKLKTAAGHIDKVFMSLKRCKTEKDLIYCPSSVTGSNIESHFSCCLSAGLCVTQWTTDLLLCCEM